MSVRRPFMYSRDMAIDAYGANEVGGQASSHIPVDALRAVGWLRAPKQLFFPLEPEKSKHRAELVAARIRDKPVDQLSNDDFIESVLLANTTISAALESRFQEMAATWQSSRLSTLSLAAGALLRMNPSHLDAASSLAQTMLAPHVGRFDRGVAAAQVRSAFRWEVQTEAMASLGRALIQLVRGRTGVIFGPFAYVCVGHLFRLAPEKTLMRCRRELKQREAEERLRLIMGLADTPGWAPIHLLRQQFRKETSLRLKVRLVNILGRLLSEPQRRHVLSEALTDESPSLRWQAITSLRLVRIEVARELAASNARSEPDQYLRMLLEEVAGAGEAATDLSS